VGNYNAIDADGHVLEPPHMWGEYLDPAFASQAPEMFVDEDGRDRLRLAGKVFGGPRGLGFTGAATARRDGMPEEMHFEEGRKGGFDPDSRVMDLDLDGIDAVFLYPTLGLMVGGVDHPGLAAALCRAYNRYINDFCSGHPERLFPVAMLPMQDVALTLDEMKYAANELGIRSGFLRPNPYNGLLLSDKQYDVVWAAAQDLNFSIAFHEGTGGMPASGVDRVSDFAARHMVSHTLEMMIACLNVIWGGVCERFPRVRFAFLESGGGWIVPWLDRMDRHFEQSAWSEGHSPLQMPPSEYFKRQCWVSFEPSETSIPYVAELLGGNKCMWATDYPHFDGWFPGAVKMISDKLPPSARQQVLAQSAMEFYDL